MTLRHLELLSFLQIRRHIYLQRLRLINPPFYDFCVIKKKSIVPFVSWFQCVFFVYFIIRVRYVFVLIINVSIFFLTYYCSVYEFEFFLNVCSKCSNKNNVWKTHVRSRFQCPYYMYYLVTPQPYPLLTTNSLLRTTAVIASKPQSNTASSRCSD